MDDQQFLTTALAASQGDETEQKRVLLEYQQAIFETLVSFQPCQDDGADFRLLKKRASQFLEQTKRYQQTLAVIPRERILSQVQQTQTLFGDVGRLCADCQRHIQQTILAMFRTIHGPTP